MKAKSSGSNVVVVLLDDLGFADFGCYGSEIRTPVIDGLANRGLRFNNFHTTAICSPSRASLLTGRNPHSVGIGTVIDYSDGGSGYPGYRGEITPHAGTIAQVLGRHGYATFAAGKWHVMSGREANAAGPFHNWPLQRGFDRWFGFHNAMTDQWHPELYEDNRPIDESPYAGDHLTDQLVSYSISAIQDLRVGSERPFFLYLAPGAVHFPLQAPAEYIERYAGQYDEGWDVIRAQRFERQKAIGLIPPETNLPERNPDVAAWEDLTAHERRVFARQQEVYSGFVEHTDDQLGRLVDYLAEIGELDDTLFILTSDNGASADGGRVGAINGRTILQARADELVTNPSEQSDRYLEQLGGPETYPHYPNGWAQASNTPLRWYKMQVHGGGVRDPLVVHWPRRISRGGEIRPQFGHIVDLMPSILDALDLEAPDVLGGVSQMPIEGTSFAHTWADLDEPVSTHKHVQYFEQLGCRALWRDGWKAVVRHYEGDDFDSDAWELFNLDYDFSEAHDLAESQPERLAAMVEEWWTEAAKYGVLPLDDRRHARKALAPLNRQPVTHYRPGMSRIDRWHVPDFTDRDFAIVACIGGAGPELEGVLLSIGSRFGGLVLYVHDRQVVFEYVYSPHRRTKVRSETVTAGDDVHVRVAFRATGPLAGEFCLSVDGWTSAPARVDAMWPVTGLDQGLHCGRDGASPVGINYAAPFPFTGRLKELFIEVPSARESQAREEEMNLLAYIEQ